MNGAKRLDGLHNEIYVIYELLLDKSQKEELVRNIQNNKDTEGILRIKAVRTSEVDISLQDSKPREYFINTKDICCYEILGDEQH